MIRRGGLIEKLADTKNKIWCTFFYPEIKEDKNAKISPLNRAQVSTHFLSEKTKLFH